jgi:hypothetical protein
MERLYNVRWHQDCTGCIDDVNFSALGVVKVKVKGKVIPVTGHEGP